MLTLQRGVYRRRDGGLAVVQEQTKVLSPPLFFGNLDHRLHTWTCAGEHLPVNQELDLVEHILAVPLHYQDLY